MGQLSGRIWAFLIGLAACTIAEAQAEGRRDTGMGAATEPRRVDVFVSGKGYPTYRIPALVVTSKGALVALCEGRHARGDHSKNDIVVRRSTDGGKTWGPMKVVHDDADNSLNNPCALVDPATGRIVAVYNRFAQGFHTHNCVPGYTDPRANRVFLVASDDEGATWSKPRDVTRAFKRPEVRWGVSTPGQGIALRRGRSSGRLVVPMIQCRGPGCGLRRSYACYSDDHGKTWQRGDEAPVPGPAGQNCAAEPTVAELADGLLLMNCRNNSRRRPLTCRRATRSSDGGRTWADTVDVSELVSPNCQASILRHSFPTHGGRSRILFANPASKRGRKNGTVRLSYDEGKTWPVSKVIHAGGYAYCSLAALPDGTIGLLYEADGYRRIVFARFTLAWLTDGKDGGE